MPKGAGRSFARASEIRRCREHLLRRIVGATGLGNNNAGRSLSILSPIDSRCLRCDLLNGDENSETGGLTMASRGGRKRSPTDLGNGGNDVWKELRTSHGCGTDVADRWALCDSVQLVDAVAADPAERMTAALCSAAAADCHPEVQRSSITPLVEGPKLTRLRLGQNMIAAAFAEQGPFRVRRTGGVVNPFWPLAKRGSARCGLSL